MIDIGGHAGSGGPNIFNVWEEEGWGEPVIEESLVHTETWRENGIQDLTLDEINEEIRQTRCGGEQMVCCAVIDTNVLVSALLSSHDDAATVRVVERLFSGEVIPLFS